MILADLTDTKYKFKCAYEIIDGESVTVFTALSENKDDKYYKQLTWKESRALEINCLRMLSALNFDYDQGGL